MGLNIDSFGYQSGFFLMMNESVIWNLKMPIADFNMEIRYKIVLIHFFMIDSQKLIFFSPTLCFLFAQNANRLVFHANVNSLWKCGIFTQCQTF